MNCLKQPLTRIVLAALLLLALPWGCARGELEFADGESANLADYDGQWVVINYWAEWCAPCREELPELNELNARAEVQVLGVNFDGIQGEPLTTLIEKMGIEFPVLLADPRARWQLEQPSVLPTTLVLTPDGVLEHQLTGPQTLAELLQLFGLAGAAEVPAAE